LPFSGGIIVVDDYIVIQDLDGELNCFCFCCVFFLLAFSLIHLVSSSDYLFPELIAGRPVFILVQFVKLFIAAVRSNSRELRKEALVQRKADLV
jgi:hypothetical protein